jgi:hypothetical protein
MATSTAVGPNTFSIDCKRSRTHCYEEAATVCPRGYDVLDGSEQAGSFTQVNAYGNTAVATSYPTYEGQMLVRCSTGERAAGQ